MLLTRMEHLSRLYPEGVVVVVVVVVYKFIIHICRRASDTETSSGVQVEICPSITYFGEVRVVY